MVSIDTVYQRVLALANKEQRGYITPQEFNLLANQAQVQIFEQYFYDLNQFHRNPGNDSAAGDSVDDIEDNIYTLERSLKKDGFENISTANCGNAALDQIKEKNFDLILLDLMMPDISGLDVLKQLKGNPSDQFGFSSIDFLRDNSASLSLPLFFKMRP